MPEPEFKAAVGMSREWDAYGAGREVAQNTLDQLGEKPDFFLLFSTIHYEKYGGFKKFLEGVWDVLPKGTPLIGGTVAGFINPQGCYTRGATALAVKYPNMDVAIGIGKNTKRNPKKAARDCAQMIKKGLVNSRNKNKYFLCFLSAASVPNTPVTKNKKVIRSMKGLNIFLKSFEIISSKLQIGPGRDEEIINEFSNMLLGYEGIGGASCDSLDLEKNYQFFMSESITNCIVSIALSIDKNKTLTNSYGLRPTGRKLNITETSSRGYIIKKINKHPAVSEYLKTMGWSDDILDERLYRKIFYFPLVQKRDGILETRMFGLVYGNYFIFPMKPKKGESEIYISSGRDIINSTLNLFNNNTYNSGFLISCGTRLETLGDKTYNLKQILDRNLKGGYLLLFTAGEYIIHNNFTLCAYQSDNAIFF